MPPLTKDIKDFVKQWNLHHIRPAAFASCPGSIPDDMFEMPEYYGTHYNPIAIHVVVLELCRCKKLRESS